MIFDFKSKDFDLKNLSKKEVISLLELLSKDIVNDEITITKTTGLGDLF